MNIIQIHIKTDNRIKVLEYKDKVVSYVKKADKNSLYLPKFLYSLANIFYYLEEYNPYEEYLKEALILSKDHKDTSLFPSIFLKLLNFYRETKQFQKINDLAKIFITKIDNFKINNDFIIILKILLNYMEQNNIMEARYLIENLLNGEV